MEKTNIGEIFIFRELYYKNNANKKVVINIGKPVKSLDSDNYKCPYQIIGIGNDKIGHVYGIDGVQALQLAIDRIGIILNTSNIHTLMWVGSEDGFLGFPTSGDIKKNNGFDKLTADKIEIINKRIHILDGLKKIYQSNREIQEYKDDMLELQNYLKSKFKLTELQIQSILEIRNSLHKVTDVKINEEKEALLFQRNQLIE